MRNCIADKLLGAELDRAEAALRALVAGAGRGAEAYLDERIAAVRTLAEGMQDEADEAALHRALAAMWRALQDEWQRHSDAMSVRLFSGEGDPDAAISGTIVSGLQQVIVDVLPEEDIHQLYAEAG